MLSARAERVLHFLLAGLGAGALVLALVLMASSPASGQELRFFRVGTGGVAGTYYPIGGLVTDIISSPPGARTCEQGGSCGVPGLVAVAQSSEGSVDNIEGVIEGRMESGFAQSDIVYGAYHGTGVFEGRPPAETLRVIASLYLESVHLVVHPEAGIETVHDLAGKRISLDEPGSGTLVNARLILEAFGVSEDDLEPFYVKPSPAMRMMRQGELDGFFFVAGWPTSSVVELTDDIGAELVPLEGPEIDQLLADYPFFTPDLIPFHAYRGVPATETVGVVAQWVTSAELEEELIYGVTRALWHPTARQLLDTGHAKAREITLDTALDGVGIPLHEGAARYYREVGLLD